MNDAIHHAPLPLPDPLLRPRGWRSAAEAGGAPPATGPADEPSPQQAVAMAVLGSANAPASVGAGAFAQAAAAGTRSRYATLVARGTAAAGQVLAALSRNVRTTLQTDESDITEATVDAFMGDVPPSGDFMGAPPCEGSTRAAPSPSRARSHAQPPAAPAGARLAPVLRSTVPVVRVRAVHAVHGLEPPPYWTMFRIVAWGLAMACSLTLAAAYWLIVEPARAPADAATPATQEREAAQPL